MAKSAFFLCHVRSSACQFLYVSAILPLEEFLWNLVLRTFMNLCQDSPNLVTIWQKYWGLYMKTWLSFFVANDINSTSNNFCRKANISLLLVVTSNWTIRVEQHVVSFKMQKCCFVGILPILIKNIKHHHNFFFFSYPFGQTETVEDEFKFLEGSVTDWLGGRPFTVFSLSLVSPRNW